MRLPVVAVMTFMMSGCGYQLGISPDKLPGSSSTRPNVVTQRIAPPDPSVCDRDPDVGLAQRKAAYIDDLAGDYAEGIALSNDERENLRKLNEFGRVWENASSCTRSLVRRSTWNFGAVYRANTYENARKLRAERLRE